MSIWISIVIWILTFGFLQDLGFGAKRARGSGGKRMVGYYYIPMTNGRLTARKATLIIYTIYNGLLELNPEKL